MATTSVTITAEQEEKYTWASCPHTWKSIEKSWKYAGGPVSYTADVAEDYEWAVIFSKEWSLQADEVMQLSEDGFTKEYEAVYSETMDFDEEFSKLDKFIRFFTTKMTASDALAKDFERSKQETLSVSESVAKDFEKVSSETLETTDKMSRTFKVWRTLEESLDIETTPIKEFDKELEDEIEFYDAYLGNADGVLSNLYIETEDMDEDEFIDIVNTPGGGYTKFYEFKVGEYEYQEALVRMTIETTTPQSEPNIADIVMHVDIPDTDDSGVEQIVDTENPTKVYFNKSYYTTPEVAVVVIGGNTGDGSLYANLISVDGEDDAGRYFEVEIINSSGELTTGLISWFAKGY